MVTILYETDFNHSLNYRIVIGVFTNRQKLLSAVKKEIRKDLEENPQDKEGQELKDYINWNFDFFCQIGQTQGLSSFELHSEQIEPNKIV